MEEKSSWYCDSCGHANIKTVKCTECKQWRSFLKNSSKGREDFTKKVLPDLFPDTNSLAEALPKEDRLGGSLHKTKQGLNDFVRYLCAEFARRKLDDDGVASLSAEEATPILLGGLRSIQTGVQKMMNRALVRSADGHQAFLQSLSSNPASRFLLPTDNVPVKPPVSVNEYSEPKPVTGNGTKQARSSDTEEEYIDDPQMMEDLEGLLYSKDENDAHHPHTASEKPSPATTMHTEILSDSEENADDGEDGSEWEGGTDASSPSESEDFGDFSMKEKQKRQPQSRKARFLKGNHDLASTSTDSSDFVDPNRGKNKKKTQKTRYPGFL